MARILPRLLAQLARNPQPPSFAKFVLSRRRQRALHRPVPPPPSFQPRHNPKSILLHDPPNNPITRSRVYIRHKALPPRHDGMRMTREERLFWSSPYLRMLASPLRQCITTNRFLPTDFLIRLSIQRIPPSHIPPPNPTSKRPGPTHTQTQTFLPDGLQHTQFTARRSGKALYTLCSRTAIARLADPAVKRRAANGVPVHPLLADQIAHLLRLRVLQELEVLADRLESFGPRQSIDKGRGRGKWKEKARGKAKEKEEKENPTVTPTTRLIRRLTRAEWTSIRETKQIPYPRALAVLIVPPLQKDPATGRRPEPSMSAAPPPPEDFVLPAPAPNPQSHSHPPCELYPVHAPLWDAREGRGVLPEEEIPLYSAPALFPAKSQRAALHALLKRVLALERRTGVSAEGTGGDTGMGKASHAFLMCSNEESVSRGDTVGVAIALWRLRMFEDVGEDVASQRVDGWEWTKRRD